MENITITKQEFEEMSGKSKKWDALGKRIKKYYCDKTGEYNEENPELKGDLGDIGEAAASAFGWL